MKPLSRLKNKPNMSFFSSFLRGENSTDDAWKDHPWFPVSTMAPQPHPYYDDPDLFPPPKDPIAPPKTWVVQHLKEPRFGIGYLLSTGAVSVSFNDRTNIILSNESSNFEYIEQSKHSSSSSTDATTPKRHAHTLNNFPDHLKKKSVIGGAIQKAFAQQRQPSRNRHEHAKTLNHYGYHRQKK